jgi:hypothetical protein
MKFDELTHGRIPQIEKVKCSSKTKYKSNGRE